jgi:uncharacterized LabA/DUF88 family protein
MRIKIFIDFWNFQLSWNEYHARSGRTDRPPIPWHPKLVDVIVKHVGAGNGVYAGTHVFVSIDPDSQKDRKLRGFLNVMDGFPGYDVLVKERKPTGPYRCQTDGCRKTITECPHCGHAINRKVEKGVDTAIVTDLIRLGIDDYYDRAVLVAGDTDHVPAVEFLGRRMKQVTHAWFRGQSIELRNACWDHLLFDNIMAELI